MLGEFQDSGAMSHDSHMTLKEQRYKLGTLLTSEKYLNMFGIVDSVEFILSEFIMSLIMLFFGDVSRDAAPIIKQV